MVQYVFLMGATGRVGSEYIRQVFDKQDSDIERHANPTQIIGLASRIGYDFSADGISREQALLFSSKKIAGRAYSDPSELLDAVRLFDAAKYRHDSDNRVAFIDATSANEPMTAFHLDVIRNSRAGIVTANKNPISLSPYNTFVELTEQPGRYGYRCSVMAGAEAVLFMRDLPDLDDKLLQMQGCFSGTLGYICSGLDKGMKFSEILKEAYMQGYTEPDPRDDLNGLDVARKLTVLARSAGYALGIDHIAVKPFIDPSYFKNESIDDFLSSAHALDGYFEQEVAKAHADGNVLRYVAEMVKHNGLPHFSVSLKAVPKTSDLGLLEGTMNKIVIFTEIYSPTKQNPNKRYAIEAPGAGLDVTARNIRVDLLSLLNERKIRR